MKILFINISDIIGGAAITAKRLGDRLEKNYNFENYFIVRTKVSKSKNIFPSRRNSFIYFVERWINILFNLAGLQYIYLPFSPREILRLTKKIKPDIISLHNILGGYFSTDLLIKLSQIAPIVWTLHDMWAITANASHTLGDDSWKKMRSGKYEKKIFPQIGINTGNWLIKRKKKIYEKSNIMFVTPSNWLYNIVTASPLTIGKKIFCIHNGVDLEIFKPRNKTIIRNKINIPTDAKVITFIAEKFKKNPFKGGGDLFKILEILDKQLNKEIHLLIIGKNFLYKNYMYKNIILHYFDYIKDEKKLSELLSATDLYIYPTKADTLPNVLIEAIACGTPCITFDIGGCEDIIKNDVSGYLIPQSDLNLFCEKSIELLGDKEQLNILSHSCRQYAEKYFSIDLMANRYFKIFEELKNENG